MDISIVTGISLLETAALVGPLHVLSLSALGTLVGFIATQYLVVLTYNAFVWPFYVSPLRSLPTPEVGQDGTKMAVYDQFPMGSS